MTLPSPGNPISLDQMHVEVGGTTGTTCSLNDSDIRVNLDWYLPETGIQVG